MFILRSVRKSNWVGTGFQKHDKQDRGQKKIIHFHIVSESFPRKTLQISVEKEGLPLIYMNKAQTKSPTHHRHTTNVSCTLTTGWSTCRLDRILYLYRAYMTRSVHLHRHDVLTLAVLITLSNDKHDTVLRVLKSGWW